MGELLRLSMYACFNEEQPTEDTYEQHSKSGLLQPQSH